ncbi:MAG: cytochrome c peroxidase [Campylobacterota bacterium]|nr:cytochrome c peroxidase [Campylobacterota bacterium]
MIKKILLFLFIINTLLSKELITPIPLIPDYDYKKAILGEQLFFDTKLSANDTISCASCHFIEDGGDDNLPVSFGIDGKKGTRNSPTVLNSRYNVVQFWDGSAKDLQEQAKGPIHNPVEMGTNFKDVVKKLKKDKDYQNKFSSLYKDGITGLNITDAISEFEKTLTTPNSRFDKFLRGDKKALTNDELSGYNTFKEYGCISCHNGVNIGGNLMQKIGVTEDFKTTDFGKYHITKNEEDKFYFKVPTLRNIELTAPYFHDGKTETLKDAVQNMAIHQVGYPLEEKEIENILKFLKTLSGDTPKFIKNRNEKITN